LDASALEEKCKFLFERANRKFLKVLEYDNLVAKSKKGGGPSEVMRKLTEKIPFEIEQFFDSVSAHQNMVTI